MSESNEADSVIPLPEEFVLSSLSELKAAIDGFIENKPTLSLDGSKVDRVDGAALQFLWQCHSFCAAKELPFEFRNPSETICEALADLGMQKLLPDN